MIWLRMLWFGRSVKSGSVSPVIGLVLCSFNHRAMLVRSYVCPSHAITGSVMTSVVMGQKNAEGVDDASFAPRIFRAAASIIALGGRGGSSSETAAETAAEANRPPIPAEANPEPAEGSSFTAESSAAASFE